MERDVDGVVRLRFPGLATPLRTDDAVVVTLRPGARPPPALLAAGRRLGEGRSFRVPVPAGSDVVRESVAWKGVDGVADAFPDVWLPKRAAAFDDPDRGAQWYLDTLGMDPLYAETTGDPDLRVAVLDSGVDIAHPDLAAGVFAPLDVIDHDDDPSPVPGEDCPAGDETSICDNHGTSVSGIVAARADNGVDIVGLCPDCTLIPIRMIGGTLSGDVEAFEHTITQDAAVLNNSWGYTTAGATPLALADAIARVVAEGHGGQGALVVFAAGNDDRQLEHDEITNEPGVLCVSATDRYGLPTAYTNRGRSVDVAAPSATVTLAPGGGILTTFGGTSAAAPVVSGLAGWIRSYDPSLTADDVTALLIETAHKSPTVTFDDEGHHDVYGYGEIDPGRILARLRGDPTGTGDTAVAGDDPHRCGCAAGAVPSPVALGLALLALRRRR